MNKYLISIDFASKLGWSIWDKLTLNLIAVGSFDFEAKEYKKLFKDSKFQQKQFEKVVFEQQSAKKLVNDLLSKIPTKENTKIDIIIEYSDFGFKYTVARTMRLLTCFLIELNEFNKDKKYVLNVSTIIAVSWRKAFTDNNKDFDYSKYESKSRNNRKKINWKPLARDWVDSFFKNNDIKESDRILFNNDITDSILIGWTWLNWMDSEKLTAKLK